MHDGEVVAEGKMYIVAISGVTFTICATIVHRIQNGVIHYSGCLPYGTPFPVFRDTTEGWDGNIVCVSDDITRGAQEQAHDVADKLNKILNHRIRKAINEHVIIESMKFSPDT